MKNRCPLSAKLGKLGCTHYSTAWQYRGENLVA